MHEVSLGHMLVHNNHYQHDTIHVNKCSEVAPSLLNVSKALAVPKCVSMLYDSLYTVLLLLQHVFVYANALFITLQFAAWM